MMRGLLMLVLCGVVMPGWAQKFIVTGQVLDTLKQGVPSATVMLLQAKDSSLVNFAATDTRGVFEMRNVNKGSYQVKVTFVGMTPIVRSITTGTESTIDVGRLMLEPLNKQLDDLVIVGEKAPVTVKRDTIEFNATSFKTKANANVEDLLKKLPGVEVDTDGTVKAQGEQVQRVTVDGREFFGRDPKLATRNLPADAVDKVQVFDKKSDQAVFTGIDDGQREKTINLELKEEKRLGAYDCKLKKGTIASRAYGSDTISERHRHRYEVNPNYVKQLEEKGLVISGLHPKNIVEIVEWKDGFGIATQPHIELKSRLEAPSPIFVEFMKAAKKLP
jgi:hypothetical protein